MSQIIDYYKITSDLIEKLSIPIAIVFSAVIFKPSIEELIPSARKINVLGVVLEFEDTKGFRGAISAYAFYRLINAADCDTECGSRFEDTKIISATNELRDKNLITYKIEDRQDRPEEMAGTWAVIKLTDKGKEFLKDIELYNE